MRKLRNMILALAFLAVLSFGCGAYAAKENKETKTLCPKCGVETQQTEEMKRFQKESAHE